MIQNLWASGGPFIGEDGKPNTVVTVQQPWSTADVAVIDGDEDHVIHPTWTKAGNYFSRGIPLRWYQKANNSQTETTIPNVVVVTIDRSIEADAATCNIVVYNQWMRNNSDVASATATEIGIHGYFTSTHGKSPEAQARWGHEANSWEDVLTPNAIIRTYQGYGGHNKTLVDALADGNLLLNGIWLVDEVRVSSDGRMTITCRDTAKLLIEQQLYPPLVPPKSYPLQYYRYVIDSRKITAAARKETITTKTTTNIPTGDKRIVFLDSSVDRWYPTGATGSDIDTGGFVLHGHKAVDCLDGNLDTFCLSVGNSSPDRPFCTDWWEFDCGEQMNAVYMHPWGGNYTMYVSVMEAGKWVGTQTVPYDPSALYGSQSYVVNTGANIPYVASFGTPWETGQNYVLPRLYNAQRVRISFRNHTRSIWGPWYYRCGMRELKIRVTNGAGTMTSTTTETVTIPPVFFAADAHPVSGYLTSSQFWQVDNFGESRKYPADGATSLGEPAVGIRHSVSAKGYYVLGLEGNILTFGDATHLGDPKTDDGFVYREDVDGAIDMAITPSGNGYWVVTSRSGVYAYGDAATYTLPARSGSSYWGSIESHPTTMGYWLMDTNGKVHAFGACVDYGDWSETTLNSNPASDRWTEDVNNIRSNTAGDGYWIMSNTGRVQAFGAAQDWGQIETPIPVNELNFLNCYTRILPGDDGLGYLLVKGDGNIYPRGTVDFYGGPIPGTQGQIRKNGNYRDYVDIIRDLALWSGFLLFDDTIQSNETPAVYGALESTGAFAEEQLPDDLFDKRPVIDAMTELKETVGYLLFVDDEGRLRFESPNWWSQGNFDESGEQINFLPEVDEKVNMSDYTVSFNDESLRSLIIIASEDPDVDGTTTVNTKLVPQTAQGLKGLLVPAMWVNGWFTNPAEQRLMAELISLHIWFQQRIGQVSCVANPCIQINDQVRIYERTTAETFIHYVRGISSNHDLETGEFTMTLTTNWLGDGEDWAITADSSFAEDPNKFVVSQDLYYWIKELPARATEAFGGDYVHDATWKELGTPSGVDGAAT